MSPLGPIRSQLEPIMHPLGPNTRSLTPTMSPQGPIRGPLGIIRTLPDPI